MPQHNFNITVSDANTGITFRAAVNAALQALAGLSSGTGDPSITYPYQLKVNTASNPMTLVIRNAANNAWIQIGHFDANGKLIIDTGYGVTSVTANYTATLNDEVILANATADAVAVTLPTAVGNTGKKFVVKKIDSSVNAVTVDPNGSETIDGQATAGILAQDNAIICQSDGANWRNISKLSTLPAIRDIARGLVVMNNITNPNYQVDIDINEIVLQDNSSLSLPYIATAVDLTLESFLTASSQAISNGGEAPSTWYYLWVIHDNITVAGLLSTSNTAPIMPSGYTYKALVGAVYNNSSSNFISLYQQGARVRCDTGTFAPANTSATSTSIATFVPVTAKMLHCRFYSVIGNYAGYVHPVSFAAYDDAWVQFIAENTSSGSGGSAGCSLEKHPLVFFTYKSGAPG